MAPAYTTILEGAIRATSLFSRWSNHRFGSNCILLTSFANFVKSQGTAWDCESVYQSQLHQSYQRQNSWGQYVLFVLIIISFCRKYLRFMTFCTWRVIHHLRIYLWFVKRTLSRVRVPSFVPVLLPDVHQHRLSARRHLSEWRQIRCSSEDLFLPERQLCTVK